MDNQSPLPLKLLLLEDQADSREATEIRLKNMGYEVIPTSTGEDAIQAVSKSQMPFSGMVMDIRIDGSQIDGLLATQRIQQDLHRTIPAVILSAYNEDPSYRMRADQYDLSIYGWVGKPDLKDEMIDHLEDLAKEAHRVKSNIMNAFEGFVQDPDAGLQALRTFLAEKIHYDPYIISYVLGRLEESVPEQASEFIAQVNFITFEVNRNLLLEKYEDEFVAFWRGALVGHHEVEDELIRKVYKEKNTTDLFITRLHSGIRHLPDGRPVRFRREDGFLQ